MLALALVAGAGIYAAATAATRPVLWQYTEEGDPLGEPAVSILNPFRDRAPERPAVELLESLKKQDYASAFAKVVREPERRAELTANEKEHPLRGWRLMNRTGRAASTRLYYRATRERASGPSPLWITVSCSAGRCRVIDADILY